MKYAIGIDIGGTITKIGLVSEQGKCLEKTSFRTKEFESFSNYIIQLDKSINDLTKNNYANARIIGTVEEQTKVKEKILL